MSEERLIEELRGALSEANDTIEAQDRLLGRLTMGAERIGTVMEEVGIPSVDDLKKGKRSASSYGKTGYPVGSKVKVATGTPESTKWLGQSGGLVGVVYGYDSDGWAKVEWANGHKNVYPIDKGRCGLTLVDGKPKFEPLHRVLVAAGGSIIMAVADETLPKLSPGDQVALAPTGQILGLAANTRLGEATFVKRVVDKTCVEIESYGSTKVVLNGGVEVSEGDKVVMDSTGSIVLRSLGKANNTTYAFKGETGITWDSIGGLVEAKQALIEAIEMPYKYPELFKRYGKKPPKGVMLYGPPGCGKTMLGKAVATSIAKAHKGEDTTEITNFFYVKGAEILDRFVGVAEATIRSLFVQAREHRLKHGYPAVIFLDEADAIMRQRGSGVSSDIEKTIVPTFLAEMDGVEESGAIVLIATNRPDTLDSAIVRDGRIDRKIRISRPDRAASVEILNMYIKGKPLNDKANTICNKTADALFDKSKIIMDLHTEKDTHAFRMCDLVNGAMLANVVDRATGIALRREIEGGKNAGLGGGITITDMLVAVSDTFESMRDIDHSDAIREVAEANGLNIKSVARRMA